MRRLWDLFLWMLGLGQGELVTWWEGLDFYVQFQDSRTKEILRLFKCTCKMGPDRSLDHPSDWDLESLP